MPSWWDSLFGDVPLPARPTSRGAMLGMGGYQGMPDTTRAIEDRRQEPEGTDYAYWMKKAQGGSSYPSSFLGPTQSDIGVGYDPMPSAQYTLPLTTDVGEDTGVYKSSFQQNWKPPFPRQAAYRRSEFGPNLDPHPYGLSRHELPYISPHLPWSPGDRGWTPPPSPSGPHNPQGDPTRPGLGQNFAPNQLAKGLTLNSWGL